jgi:DNA-binding beta-propeller fold protein YncE
VIGRIPVGPNPEGIALVRGKAYVANSEFGSGKTVSIIDVASRSVSRTLVAGDGPISVGVTSLGMVYVLCSGFYNDWMDPLDDTPCRIAVIDPVTDAVVDSVVIGDHASSMALTADGLCYVLASDSVVVVDTRLHRNLGTFVRGAYYAVGVDYESGDVYLADAKNYIQAGTVSVYASDGLFRTRFDVGVNPGQFLFKH